MSEAHYHTSDSGCLTAVPALWFGKYVEGQPVMEARAGWWRCDRLTSAEGQKKGGDLAGAVVGNMRFYAPPNGYLVHEHAGKLFAHEPRDGCAF